MRAHSSSKARSPVSALQVTGGPAGTGRAMSAKHRMLSPLPPRTRNSPLRVPSGRSTTRRTETRALRIPHGCSSRAA